MSIGMPYVTYLSRRGFLDGHDLALLDIGSQCLLAAAPEEILDFVVRHGGDASDPSVRREAERVAYFSTPRAGERTSYLSELTDLTHIRYVSYDVCPALKTEIFDLNRQSIPREYQNRFDVVLNFGTTEHVINQFNCFKVIHDALRVDGVAFHQLPSVGWIDHGYFCYHLALFKDLAAANDYDIVDSWYTPTGVNPLPSAEVPVRAAETPEQELDAASAVQVPCYLVNVVLRKRSNRSFRLPLELATAHAQLAETIQEATSEPEVPPAAAVPARAGQIDPAAVATASSRGDLEGSDGERSDIKSAIVNAGKSTYRGLVAAARRAATPQPRVRGDDDATDSPADGSAAVTGSDRLDLDPASHYAKGVPLLEAGDLDAAFAHFSRALAVVHKYGPAVAALRVLSQRYQEQARGALERGEHSIHRSFLVRSVEAAPDNSVARAELDALISADEGTDLTRRCFVFHDPARAGTVHREAVLRCMEYVSIAGVIGDVLEFGVLAGWSARIFAETMREVMNMGTLRLFDSFEGLPEYESEVDQNSYEIKGRNLWADRMRFPDDFIRELGSSIESHVRERLAGVLRSERIVTHCGYYSDSLKQPLQTKAALIHIDCDLYQSTAEVLHRLYEMNVYQDGCVLMFDDWNCNKASPNYGERRAFHEFLDGQDRYTCTPFFTYGFNGATFFLHERAS